MTQEKNEKRPPGLESNDAPEESGEVDQTGKGRRMEKRDNATPSDEEPLADATIEGEADVA